MRVLLLSLGLLGGLLCQCSSGAPGTADRSPVVIGERDPVEVRYQHFRSGFDQTLRTAAMPAARRNGRAVPSKVIAPDAMQALLGALAAHGFFSHAVEAPPSNDPGNGPADASAPAARAMLTVRVGERAQAWIRRDADPSNIAELSAFNAALQEFLTLFNQTYSYESAVGDSGRLFVESVQQQAGSSPAPILPARRDAPDGAGAGRGK